MADEDLHSTDSSVSGEGHSTILLTHPRIFTRLILIYIFWFKVRAKLFSNAGLDAKLHIFALDQIKEENNSNKKSLFFWATLSNFRYKKQLLTFFEQLFEELRETFWEIPSNLWKALIQPRYGVLSGLISYPETSGSLFSGWSPRGLWHEIVLLNLLLSYCASRAKVF